MGFKLASLPYANQHNRRSQEQFGGYDHRSGAQNGGIWDMENMSGAEYPFLTPRKPRYLVQTVGNPGGLYARDGLFVASGNALYRDGERVCFLKRDKETMVGIGSRVVMLLEEEMYDSDTGEVSALEARWSAAAKMCDGTLADVSAEGNTILIPRGSASGLKVGDAVTISGCLTHPENNLTAIIREIGETENGIELRFYENTFTVAADDPLEALEIERLVPDMDFVCEHGNRLWGCKGNTIMCCKLGDPTNWNVFDGLSTDSWQASVGSPGEFTGCCSYGGQPVFFKEDVIYTVYGDYPAEFQIVDTVCLGVAAGSHKSLAQAAGRLFYLSRAGVMVYGGSLPQSLNQAFGTVRYRNAVGGSDGERYFVSMEDTDGQRSLFVYDTQTGLWHREDDTDVMDFAWQDGLYMLTGDGRLLLQADAVQVPKEAVSEGAVRSWAEFGDFTESMPEKKGVCGLRLRIGMEAGAQVTVKIRYDSTGQWRTLRTLGQRGKRSVNLPVRPRRCDHYRLRIEGVGQWRLESMSRDIYAGSDR